MTSHSPESVSLPLAIQASSTQTSLDADRGSHDVSSAAGSIREESRNQSSVAKDVGPHKADHPVREPPGSSPIQHAVPATAEGHGAADEGISPSSPSNDAPAEAIAPISAANRLPNSSRHSVLGLKTKHSLPKPQAPPQRELLYFRIASTRI